MGGTLLLIIQSDQWRSNQMKNVTNKLDIATNEILSVTNQKTSLENRNRDLYATNMTLKKETEKCSELRNMNTQLSIQLKMAKDHSKQIMNDTSFQPKAMNNTLLMHGINKPTIRKPPIGESNKKDPFTIHCVICLDSNPNMTMIALTPCMHCICSQCKNVQTC